MKALPYPIRCCVVILIVFSASLRAELFPGSESTRTSLQSSFSEINKVSYLDIAGGQSPLDVKVAMGIDQVSLVSPQGSEQLRKYWLPRAWAYIGLAYPFSLGLSLAVPAEGIQNQASGFLQWTVYERPSMPAIALRASYSQLRMEAGQKATSLGSALAMSWGYQIYTLMGTVELRQDKFSLGFVDEAGDYGQSPYVVTDFGMHVQVVPAEVNLAIVVKQGREGQSLSANLQVRI